MVRVAVLGAHGHTAGFVIAQLLRRGVEVIREARTGSEGSAVRSLDFYSPASLDRALEGADAVINCAGPFLDTAEPAAEAAIRAGLPYLDLSAEQVAVLNLFNKLDAKARRAGVPLVPAIAFYGGLADLLVSALVRHDRPIETIQVAVALDGWNPTQGTRRTGARNSYPRMVIADGELTPLPLPPPVSEWDYPLPFGRQSVTALPFSEVILVHQHLRARQMMSFINDKALADVRDPATPTPVRSDAQGRSSQRFLVDVQVGAEGRRSRAIAQGRDIYAVTAPLVVAACLRLVQGAGVPGGVHAPGAIFEPAGFLKSLEPDLSTSYG